MNQNNEQKQEQKQEQKHEQKQWGGRFEKETDQEVESFSSSMDIDQRLWAVDIRASVAHARMLGAQGILTASEASQLILGLQEVYEDIRAGKMRLNPFAEDIHSDIEFKLSEKVGSLAGHLHTARSRNDQVATDTRLYLRAEVLSLVEELKALQRYFLTTAENCTENILPGFTHLQHAQPVSLAHHLMAYFWMFERDRQRLQECLERINSLPLGSAALAGTGFPIDRDMVANELEFTQVCENSLDAVGDRDFVVEFLADASLVMMHLSRLSEELIIWSTPEFAFVELGDEVTTGSSIMPQKKNPDVAELIRGKVGRLYGALMGALTMLKGLPLAYNRDLQEDKVFLFEGLDTVRASVRLMLMMLQKAEWKFENMVGALEGDFSNATELADHLVTQGLPFRQAHEVAGKLVKYCLQSKLTLENISFETLQQFHPLFKEEALPRLQHLAAMKARNSAGGTAPTAVRQQIEKGKAMLNFKTEARKNEQNGVR